MSDPFDGRSEITADEYLAVVGRTHDAPTITETVVGRDMPLARPPESSTNTTSLSCHPVDPWRIRESAFRDAIVTLARYRGWRVQWTWNSRHSPKGWPDLFLVRHGRAIAAELKIPPRKPTQEQWDWLKDLALCGIETYVWTPEMWSEIEAILGTPEPAEGEWL
jgi:hypothetical protein